MSATLELFEQYKLCIGARADRAGAGALGVKSQTVSNWRTRGSQAEPWLIEAMCTKLGCAPAPWLIRVLAEQATGAHNRKVWERLGKGLGYRMAAWIALAGLPVVGILEVGEGVGTDVASNWQMFRMAVGWLEMVVGAN